MPCFFIYPCRRTLNSGTEILKNSVHPVSIYRIKNEINLLIIKANGDYSGEATLTPFSVKVNTVELQWLETGVVRANEG